MHVHSSHAGPMQAWTRKDMSTKSAHRQESGANLNVTEERRAEHLHEHPDQQHQRADAQVLRRAEGQLDIAITAAEWYDLCSNMVGFG